MATVTGTNSRGGLAKTGGSTPVSSSSSSSSTLSAADTASRAASLATIQKNNPALAASLAPLATGGVQSTAQQAASLQAINNNKPITSADVSPTTKITLPTPVVTQAPSIGAMNAGITGTGTGVSNTPTGALTVDPIVQQSLDTGKSNFDSYLASLNKAEADRTTGADVQAQVIKDSHQKEYQQKVNDYTSQINTIVANRDAQNLGLEGTGRGQTTGFIGGEQARITKEAAIQALPIQALLANAQGNLDTANQYINTWGKILVDDANNAYNHKVATIGAVYDFANAQEKTKLDSLLTQQKEVKDKATALATAKTEAIKNALGQGAPSSVVQAITAATDLTGVATATGKYNGDLLGQEAKRASIAASYASTRASNAQAAAASGTLNGKAQTVDERKVQGFADRLVSADSTIAKLGSQFTGNTAYGNLLPTQLQSADRQVYEQAKTNFLTAKLRQESGAAISPSEYAVANVQYFPQPGDTAENIASKAANRAQVIDGLYREANVPAPKIETPPQPVLAPADIPTGYYQASDGLLYKK
jgi:hypothetical protein